MTQTQTQDFDPRPHQDGVDQDFGRLLEKDSGITSAESIKAITEAQLDSIFRHSASRTRSHSQILRDARSLATLTPGIASACIYSVPRGGKRLIGPSIRLAEIMASAWGHITISAQKIADDGKVITVQATAIDTISGVAYTVPVDRRVTDKYNNRFSDDMVIVTTNAAVSLAVRNAILRVVPGAITAEVFEHCKRVAGGDAKSLEQQRRGALEYFAGLGVDEARVCAAAGVSGPADIGVNELLILTGLRNQIADDQMTVEAAFPRGGAASHPINQKIAASPDTPASDAGRPVAVPGVDAGNGAAYNTPAEPPATQARPSSRRRQAQAPAAAAAADTRITESDVDEALRG